MKKLFTILVLGALWPYWCLAQLVTPSFHFKCGSVASEEISKTEPAYQKMVLRAKQANRARTQATTIAIQVWQVQPSSGTWRDYEPYMSNTIDALNVHFQAIGVSFYLKSFTKITSNQFYRPSDADLASLNERYRSDNALNLYFIGDFCEQGCPNYSNPNVNITFGKATVPSFLPPNTGNHKNSNGVFIATAALNYIFLNQPNSFVIYLSDYIFKTIPHEFGHYFDLYHTHEISRGVERVDGNNCASAGDMVCDTPADPGRDKVKLDQRDRIIQCELFSNYLEPGTGRVYKPMINNLMSYYSLRDYYYSQPKTCDKLPIFTRGQYERMADGLIWRTTPHPDPANRYYLDGQNRFALGITSLQQNRNQEITRVCVGNPIQIAWYKYGSLYYVDYRVSFINEASGKTEAELNNVFITQEAGEFVRFNVPANLAAGKYKIRVTSTRDGVSDDSKTLEIESTNTAQLSGERTIFERESATLSLSLTGSLPAEFSLSTGLSGTADKTPFAIEIKPARTTTYKLTRVSNVCGVGRVAADSVKITVVPITSIEPQALTTVHVYPNPAVEQLTLRFEPTGAYKLKWLNATGQVLTELSGSGSEATLPVSGPPGMYLLWIEHQGKAATFKIFKK